MADLLIRGGQVLASPLIRVGMWYMGNQQAQGFHQVLIVPKWSHPPLLGPGHSGHSAWAQGPLLVAAWPLGLVGQPRCQRPFRLCVSGWVGTRLN